VVTVFYWGWPHLKQQVKQPENGEDESENIYETIELQPLCQSGANFS
jgi:hypothetical protein